MANIIEKIKNFFKGKKKEEPKAQQEKPKTDQRSPKNKNSKKE